MADPHVISALREKRALVAGLIEKLEQHRADLTHIDGVLRLFQPDRDPGEIKPKRTYARRTRYFARNEPLAALYGRSEGRRRYADDDGRYCGPDHQREGLRRDGCGSPQGHW
jgi:hypothetical protein